ncbi:unnamed protein product [Urochloa decumbens]|uniref:F-box domain-containing protein n=1 Tax=Urochloa decumbens TaxID=240449 RepID=A0ABC8XTY9_9POAL
MANCSPLHRVTDGARWDAEDLFGRLCIVAHAAFLYAGFHPSAAPAARPWSLSCSYSVLPPETAADRQQDAATIVLRIYRPWGRRRRGQAHMSLRAHVVTAANNGGRYMEHRERLDRAALETILSSGGSGVDGVARTIRAPGSAAERLWNCLTDGICRGLFLYACEANGVPVMPDFASLPGDAKLSILEKLEDGKDLAMAECASKELSSLVAGHGSDLWKAKYEDVIISSCPNHIGNHAAIANVTRWKERYVEARRSMSRFREQQQQPVEMDPTPYPSWMQPRMFWNTRNVVREAQHPTAQRRAEVDEKSHRRSVGRAMAKVPKRSNRKEHQAGAVQSSSSQYQRKHR